MIIFHRGFSVDNGIDKHDHRGCFLKPIIAKKVSREIFFFIDMADIKNLKKVKNLVIQTKEEKNIYAKKTTPVLIKGSACRTDLENLIL